MCVCVLYYERRAWKAQEREKDVVCHIYVNIKKREKINKPSEREEPWGEMGRIEEMRRLHAEKKYGDGREYLWIIICVLEDVEKLLCLG